MNARLFINPPLIFPTAVLTVILSFWTSIPTYLIRSGMLPRDYVIGTYSWETLVILVIPLPGIFASIYGYSKKDYAGATLIGIIPYVPPVLLGLPFPIILAIGVPMGLMGAGLAFTRRGNLIGALLFGAGLLWWFFTLVSISQG